MNRHESESDSHTTGKQSDSRGRLIQTRTPRKTLSFLYSSPKISIVLSFGKDKAAKNLQSVGNPILLSLPSELKSLPNFTPSIGTDSAKICAFSKAWATSNMAARQVEQTMSTRDMLKSFKLKLECWIELVCDFEIRVCVLCIFFVL